MALVRTSKWKIGTTPDNVAPIPDPDKGVDRNPIYNDVIRTTLGGRTKRDRLSRNDSWGFTFTALTEDEASVLSALETHDGFLYLVDPLIGDAFKIEVLLTGYSDVSVIEGERNISMTLIGS